MSKRSPNPSFFGVLIKLTSGMATRPLDMMYMHHAVCIGGPVANSESISASFRTAAFRFEPRHPLGSPADHYDPILARVCGVENWKQKTRPW